MIISNIIRYIAPILPLHTVGARVALLRCPILRCAIELYEYEKCSQEKINVTLCYIDFE